MLLACVSLSLAARAVHSEHYLPGVHARSHKSGDLVKLFVNKLTSTKTQAPYDFYKLPYCRTPVHQEMENLGQILSGDHIENSMYQLEMGMNKHCAIVCRNVLDAAEASAFRDAVEEEYRVQM
ncbi:unnamed protein product [Discosporangium mesarthrocarpum]